MPLAQASPWAPYAREWMAVGPVGNNGLLWGRGVGEEAAPHPSFRSGAGDTKAEAGTGPSAVQELLRTYSLLGPGGRT